MILVRLIVVIFSVERILLTSLIWWILRQIERWLIQLRVTVVCLEIEKMKIAVWLTRKIVVWLIEKTMIVVWLIAKMRIVVWLTIFLCSEIELIELIVHEMMIESIVHEAMIVVLILIFVILIVMVFVTNNLWDCDQNRFCEDDQWRLIEIFQHYWRFLLRFRTKMLFFENSNQWACDNHFCVFQNSYASFS
jgi:hypothetical protein